MVKAAVSIRQSANSNQLTAKHKILRLRSGQTQDPSTPVSRAGENAREPSCAQDDTRLSAFGHRHSENRHSAVGIRLRQRQQKQEQTQDPSTTVSIAGEDAMDPPSLRMTAVGTRRSRGRGTRHPLYGLITGNAKSKAGAPGVSLYQNQQ